MKATGNIPPCYNLPYKNPSESLILSHDEKTTQNLKNKVFSIKDLKAEGTLRTFFLSFR